MKRHLPGFYGSLTGYHDDGEILAMARADGCGQTLQTALRRRDGKTTTAIVGSTVYVVHAFVGTEGGYSAFRLDDPRDLPLLLATLAPLIGPISTARLARRESVTRH